jgi:hypothetical protein
MRGFPHSNDPDKWMKGELWVGVTPSGREPRDMGSDERGPEDSENKGRGPHIKSYEALMKPKPPLIKRYREKLVIAEKMLERSCEGAWRELRTTLYRFGANSIDIY